MALRYFAAQFQDRVLLRASSHTVYTHVTVYPHGESWHNGQRRGRKNGYAILGVVEAKQISASKWQKLRDSRDLPDTLPLALERARHNLAMAQDYARQIGFIYQNQLLYCMRATPMERRRALSSYLRHPRDFDSWFERMNEDGGPRGGYGNPNDAAELVRCGRAQQRAWETVHRRMDTLRALEARYMNRKAV